MKNAKNRLISILILLILSFVGLMPNNSINNTNVDSTIHEKSTPTLSNLYKILGHTYDFEDETEGQDPTGITLSTNEATGCTANIENLADGQQKHLSLHKVGSTGRVWVRDNFSHFGETYTAGEYHVKVYHDNSGFGINLNSANGEAILAMVWWNGEIRDDVGGTLLSTYTLNQWLDVIIYFNLTLGWMFDLDGVRYGAGYSFSFYGPFTANAQHIWMTSFIGGGGDGYFRIDDISYFYENDNLINILSPVNNTYTKTMSGYYPATYGFEDQKIGSFPIGWIDHTRGTTSATIFPEKDGHKMVLRSFDADTVGQASATVKQTFSPQISGTVEFWVLKEAGGTGSPAWIMLRKNESSTSIIDIKIDDSNVGPVFYDEGTSQSIGNYADDQWFHIRFDFNCNLQKYDIYINSVKEVDQGDFLNPSDSVGSIVLSGSWSRTGVYYIDALSYSWDPNYNIGENMDEGLLVSFDTGVPLHTMSYSLDNQLKRSVIGDNVIPMPENGLHAIQIFGIDQYETKYQSNIKYFTINFSINIITPESRGYNEPMSGYYPATYGFESDLPGGDAKNWTHDDVSNTHSYLVDSYKGHERVYELYDNYGSGNPDTYNSYTAQTNGTLDVWVLVKISGYVLWVEVFYDAGAIATLILKTGEYLIAKNNTFDVNMTEFGIIKEDQWYHIRIDFECTNGGYMGLADDTFRVYLNGTQSNSDFIMNAPSSQANKIRITTGRSLADPNYYAYFDAVGYSWDPLYNIGDNRYEGLLLSYTNNTNLDWVGYSLDSQPNRTIFGNTSISFPKDGRHSIRVYGNNSLGTQYHSTTRYFSTHHITIVTPEDKVYTNPMSGFYPATYGFESDETGKSPNNWEIDDNGGSATVIDLFNGHEKIFHLEDSSTGGYIRVNQTFDTLQSSGVIEFWIADSNAISSAVSVWIRLLDSNDDIKVVMVIDDNQLRYQNATHQFIVIDNFGNDIWHHVGISFNASTDTCDILADGLQVITNETWWTPGDNITKIMFNTRINEAYDIYLDAFGYSWDPNYNIRDNLYEGLLLSYENSTNLNWQGYSLDAQVTKTIFGNTTIPMIDGTHFIQVIGNDSMGNMYSSDERYFTVNTGSFFDIKIPENKTYYGPMLGSFPATSGFENDEDGSNPNGWTVVETGGAINVISDIDGHSKVVEINDFSSSYMVELYRNFADQTAGTIELYLRCGDNTKRTNVFIYDGINTKSAYLFFDNNGWIRYWDTANRDIMTYNEDQWYHLRIEWNCTAAEWHLWIDGIKTQDTGYNFYGTPSAMDTIYFSTTGSELNFYSYIDAVSYSWDPNYNTGNNVYDGILLGFTKNTELNWLGYSLNGQSNKTIFGNKTIPFMNLNEGLNSIQLFGEDLRGIVYESEIRYFTVNYSIDIITPEDKTYTEPMSGYYPGTYGFENDPTGTIDENIAFIDYGPNSSIILEELDGHNKVLQIYRVGWAATQSYFAPTFEGTVEMWIRVDDSNADQIIAIGESDSLTPSINRPTVRLTVQFGNIYWTSQATEYNLISAFSSDVWYHLRIDVFSNNSFDVYLNQNLTVSKAQTFYNMTTGMNCTHFKEYDAAAKWYVDAIGYSWDPNYEIGDNLNEGLLLSYENSTSLDWQGYSLDAQSTKTILGNKTIPIPFDGEHIIRVLANDSLGEFYQSRLRHFEVCSINISTPENKTYTEPMNGYYPATYGFENDIDGTYPKNWDTTENGGIIQIISEKDGHKKVAEIHETSDSLNELENIFSSPQETGTIEYFFMVNRIDDAHNIALISNDSSHTDRIQIIVMDGYLNYRDISWIPIMPIEANRWYHLKVEFNCSADWHLWIDGVSQDNSSGYPIYGNPNNFDRLMVGSSDWSIWKDTYIWIDAVGYSWDPNYNIGDNLYKGLLLSYENRTNLDWQGYSLDWQSIKTIEGNIIISLPSNGVHTIQVFGNDTLGNNLYSAIRYFTMDYIPIELITPENKTYTEPMSGYYPATYGFENDNIFSYPSGWTSIETGGTIQISSNFDTHNKVVKINDTIAVGNNLRNNFNDVTEGIIEFWMGTDNITELNEIDVWDDGSSNWAIQLGIFSSKFQYKQSDNNWYDIPNVGAPLDNKLHHWSITFNCSTYTFNVLIDGIDSGELLFKNNHNSFDRLQFHTSDTGSGFAMYVDAIGYSWDPDYNIGDNLNEGLLLSYENSTSLDWQGYTMDAQPPKIIDGNTTITIPENGIHSIQVFGNDTFGTMFYSEVKYFTVNYTGIDIIDPIIIINSPLLYDLFGSAGPFYNISVIELNLHSTWYTLDGGLTNILITEPTGNIEQTEWDKIGNGTATIRFYANDTNGNLGFEEVTVRKDILPPEIIIYSPNINDLIGSSAPTFDLDTNDPNLATRWYSLDGGTTTFPILGSIGIINQALWDAQPEGIITIMFYAEDSVGNFGFEEVAVRKDTLPPDIVIIFPSNNNAFTDTAPTFELAINEVNLNEIWYTLSDGLVNITCGTLGQINQDYWNALPPGAYTLRFYANDLLGNEGFTDIIIIKRDPTIPGFNPILLSLMLITGILPIAWQIKKKLNLKGGFS